MKKLHLWVLCLVTLPLCACSTTKIDQAVQKSLPTICKNAVTTHIAFTAATALTDRIPERVIRGEQIAYDTVTRLCSDPASVDTATVLVAATSAYLEMTKALKAAEAVQVASN